MSRCCAAASRWPLRAAHGNTAPPAPTRCLLRLRRRAGVESVETDVAAKTCVVTHSDAATSEAMLEKLLVWSKASGKSVELAE